jgi:plasmid stabilization system protein ParE
MDTEEINIKVDPEVAAVYRKASPEQQREISNLIGYLLRQPTPRQRDQTIDRIEQTAAKATQEARDKGLTPEVFREILNDE